MIMTAYITLIISTPPAPGLTLPTIGIDSAICLSFLIQAPGIRFVTMSHLNLIICKLKHFNGKII